MDIVILKNVLIALGGGVGIGILMALPHYLSFREIRRVREMTRNTNKVSEMKGDRK